MFVVSAPAGRYVVMLEDQQVSVDAFLVDGLDCQLPAIALHFDAGQMRFLPCDGQVLDRWEQTEQRVKRGLRGILRRLLPPPEPAHPAGKTSTP